MHAFSTPNYDPVPCSQGSCNEARLKWRYFVMDLVTRVTAQTILPGWTVTMCKELNSRGFMQVGEKLYFVVEGHISQFDGAETEVYYLNYGDWLHAAEKEAAAIIHRIKSIGKYSEVQGGTTCVERRRAVMVSAQYHITGRYPHSMVQLPPNVLVRLGSWSIQGGGTVKIRNLEHPYYHVPMMSAEQRDEDQKTPFPDPIGQKMNWI